MWSRIHPLSQIGLFILLMSRPPGPFSGFSMSLLAGAPVGLGIRAWGYGSWEADPQLLLWRLRTAGGARAQGSAPCPGPAFLTTPVPRWLDAAPQ